MVRDRPPNVVIFFTDDQGFGDLSCFGHPTIHTPNVDRMAAEGVKLTQFYVASPVCSPSRAALLTGCYPKRVGMHEHVIFPAYAHGLHPDETTIADVLSGAGYATGCFGKWHLGHRPGLLPTSQAFDTFSGMPYSNDMSQFHRPEGNGYRHSLPLLRDEAVIEWEPDQRLLTRRCTEEAVAFIDAHADGPFFVYVPHAMPHIPIYAAEEFAGRSRRGTYGDVIEEIDWSVGEVLDALDRQGVGDETLVIFTTDNGPWLPYKERGGSAGLLAGGKGGNLEGGQRVPFVARYPDRIPAGLVQREIATTMDLLPTIANLAGVTLDDDRPIDGHDIMPLLEGVEGVESPTASFIYYTSRGDLAGIRRGRWKLLLEPGTLHDVESDVGERWNRADRHPDVVAELRALAIERDASITAGARPVLEVEETIWDPATVVRPEPSP
ncbi:MAG: sulfatase-like hydrolase/transferase [Planctomycetia bacterium]|nr:sulfatase-like hydrolase/transferase [Planctomycetia bacterium]